MQEYKKLYDSYIEFTSKKGRNPYTIKKDTSFLKNLVDDMKDIKPVFDDNDKACPSPIQA